MDTLPDDMLFELTQLLIPKQIIILKQVSKKFNTDEFLIKRNNKNYPRKEGQHIHKIKKFDYDINNYIITEDYIKRILFDIYNTEQDLVRGDIVEFYMLGMTGTSQDFI